MDNRDRIEELEEMKMEFIFNESFYDNDNPSWGEVADAQAEAELRWEETDEGKELIRLTK